MKKIIIAALVATFSVLSPISWAEEERPLVPAEGTVTTTNITTESSRIETVTTKTTTVSKKEAPKRLIAALFVINNLKGALQDQTDTFRSVVSSRLEKTGFQVLNQDVALEALKKANMSEQDVFGVTGKSTALGLSDMMGADYLIIARLIDLEFEQINYQRGEIATQVNINKLHVGYEVLTDEGTAFLSGAISPQRSERRTKNISVSSSNYLIGLMNEAADQITDELAEKVASLKKYDAIPAPERKLMPFTVNCVLSDLSLAPLMMPLFWINNDGSLGSPKKGTMNANIYANGAIVELDGAMIGTTPGTFEAKPGLHKLSVTRPGVKPVIRTVNIRKNSVKPQEFNIAVSATDEEVRKLKETALFFQGMLERNTALEVTADRQRALTERIRYLTPAEAERIKGVAKMLEQSGYRIDMRGNFEGKSPYDGSTINWIEANKNTLFDH